MPSDNDFTPKSNLTHLVSNNNWSSLAYRNYFTNEFDTCFEPSKYRSKRITSKLSYAHRSASLWLLCKFGRALS